MIALIIAYTITINFNSISQRGSTVLSLPEKKRKNKKREILRSTVQKGLYPQRKKKKESKMARVSAAALVHTLEPVEEGHKIC